jgi:hypothetical protein
VVGESSGDNLLKMLKPKGTISRFPTAAEGVQALVADTIDVFVFDMATNFYYASLYVDKGLTPGERPSPVEPLAWAVRPTTPPCATRPTRTWPRSKKTANYRKCSNAPSLLPQHSLQPKAVAHRIARTKLPPHTF